MVVNNQVEKPQPPAPSECCENQCSPCVWDTYFDELEAWKDEKARQKEQQEEAES